MIHLLQSDQLSAAAGYQRGRAGLPPDIHSNECRGGRFAYLRGWVIGDRKRRAETVSEDHEVRLARFFTEIRSEGAVI